METFKDIEKENKTKPHSKQGLSAEDKLDPKEKEKSEAIDWVNVRLRIKCFHLSSILQNQIRRIQDEIDRTEAKVEALSVAEAGRKRGKKEDVKKSDKEVDREVLQ
jgi:CCR4-NOT transcription complex subunit 3